MKQTIKSGEIGSPQESASVEFCFKKIDTVTSETALRIIKLVESKKSKNTETTSSNTFDCFAEGYPISNDNRNKLIQFFQDKNNNELGRLILSKTGILKLEENTNFIESFLYNSDKKADVSQFIEFVIGELENYPFVIDFEYDEIKEINIDDNPADLKEKRIFKFKNNNKRGLIVTSIDGKKYTLPEKYTKLEYRKNGTFGGIIKDQVSKTYNGEYIKFDGEEFKTIGTIDNIIDIPNLSDAEGNLKYNAIGGKKGLKKFEDDEQKNRILSEKLKPEYDLITIKNGLIFAVKDLEGGKQKIEIFSKDIKKIMLFENVSEYRPIEGFDNFFRFKNNEEILKRIGDNKFKKANQKLYNYYEISKNGEVKEIKYLQNVKSHIKPDDGVEVFNRFESGKPVFIKFIGDKYTSLQKNGESKQVKYQGDICCFLLKVGDVIMSHTFEGKELKVDNYELGFDKKLFSTYKINGEIYIFDIYNKNFYKSKKLFKTSNQREFESIKKDLDEIPLNPFENDIS